MAEWSTAVPDWEDRLLSGRSLIPALPLNRAEVCTKSHPLIHS